MSTHIKRDGGWLCDANKTKRGVFYKGDRFVKFSDAKTLDLSKRKKVRRVVELPSTSVATEADEKFEKYRYYHDLVMSGILGSRIHTSRLEEEKKYEIVEEDGGHIFCQECVKRYFEILDNIPPIIITHKP